MRGDVVVMLFSWSQSIYQTKQEEVPRGMGPPDHTAAPSPFCPEPAIAYQGLEAKAFGPRKFCIGYCTQPPALTLSPWIF